MAARRRGDVADSGNLRVIRLGGQAKQVRGAAAHAESGDPDVVVGARDAAAGSSGEEC